MKILKVKIRVIAGSASPYGYSRQALSQPNEISEKPKPFFTIVKLAWLPQN